MATSDRPPADPQTITPETFRQLLARYHDTVEAVTRRKASTPRKRKNAQPPSETEITTAVQEFLALDDWRYRELPGVVGSRAEGYLDRSEAERLVEWKMKHGKSRPTLLGMLRSNPDKTIRKATTTAYAAVTGVDELARRMDFPTAAMEALTTPLRGVGPATASLMLSVGPGDHPFYSDDTYLWVVCAAAARRGMLKGNGELNVKYNMGEYRELWGKVRELQERLVREGCAQAEVCGENVEKVALVWRAEYMREDEEEEETKRLEKKEVVVEAKKREKKVRQKEKSERETRGKKRKRE
ncbi:hypothetical protein ATEIFO6365_0010011200 [Aspergillus terreus]|uniref:Uncharacterized protein n=1 Tax=Aspergillus terreus TaxID=33178 RepID=A0A5M3ZA40_ASPTE|nr:hypothetical protein ATETN484_0012009100 [Aspergillus terreus]GFF19339.1 hypothetical protein ATEIFO6365_0010011200 [Aspergillus terreus]